MLISYHTVGDNLNTTRGFGVAGFNVVTALQRLGHKVPFDDPKAPVQLSFCQPNTYKFHPGQYRIGYTPWESTELPAGWAKMMNDCDEVWATSDWVANVYDLNGVKSDKIHVYKHGIDPKWAPVKRTPGDVVKFLHVGEPALRKGGQLVLDAFRTEFGDRTDVHLTIKCYYQHFLRGWLDGAYANAQNVGYENVTFITEEMHSHELLSLYATHDVMVYPSYGEGFGFIPLQALATGMPTICTDEWAPYADLLGPLVIYGKWNRSIWSQHPGDVLYPNYEDLKRAMRLAVSDLPYFLDYYSAQAEKVHEQYNWDSLTANAVEHLVKRFS